MKLTQRQLDVLNHVVLDGQAWVDRDEAYHLGRGMSVDDTQIHVQRAVTEKVARHESAYDSAVAQGNYKNRAMRDEEQRLAEIPTPIEAWKHAIARTDRQMPRFAEDILDGMPDKSGVAQITLDRLQEKKILREAKP